MKAPFVLPLKPRLGLFLATAAMYFFCVLGADLATASFHGFLVGIDHHSDLVQIWCLYLARMAGQFVGVWIAASIIGWSDLRNPVRAAGLITLLLQLFLTGVNLAFHGWTWLSVPELDQSIPILAAIVTQLGLVALAMFLTWLVTGPFKRYFSSSRLAPVGFDKTGR